MKYLKQLGVLAVLAVIVSYGLLVFSDRPPNNNIIANQVEQIPTTSCANNSRWNIPVLMYHHVGDIPATAMKDKIRVGLTVSIKTFQKQLASIKKMGYSSITFRDFSSAINNGVCLPSKPIILTFDDGYSDNWDSAAILKQNHMQAVYFIITGKVGLANYLNWDQIHTLAHDNNEIGSHTVSHPDLTTLSNSPKSLEKEIVTSKNILEQQGFSVISFAYPSGKYNKAIATLVGENYLFARTTHPGIFTSNSQNAEIGTVRMTNDTDLNSLLK